MSIGIVVICTNAYFILGLRFIKKFMKHYKGNHEIIFYLFTDTDPIPYAPNLNVRYFHTVHKHWQDGTNSKFKNILDLKEESCDFFYYFDADTNIDKDFTEWFLGDLVGGEHYNNRWEQEKPYDRNPLSRSYVPKDTPLLQMYFYGAFFGGKKEHVLAFCQTNYDNQQADKLIGYEPCWNDESYINHYFHYHPPTVVPSDKFAFCISDKGGIGETRDTSLDIKLYKTLLLENPTSVFTIANQTLIFETKPKELEFIEINLSTIKTIVLHNKTTQRKNHITSVLDKTTLNYSIFDCLPGGYLVSAIDSLICIYKDLLSKPFEPVLLLEDDVNITDRFKTILQVPKGDCVYLGLSTCWSSFGRSPSYSWVSINEEIVQIKDMLSTHAYVITSKEWLEVLLECMVKLKKAPTYYDIPIARKMINYKVYAFKYPFFYQDGSVGGQQAPTKITIHDIADKVYY